MPAWKYCFEGVNLYQRRLEGRAGIKGLALFGLRQIGMESWQLVKCHTECLKWVTAVCLAAVQSWGYHPNFFGMQSDRCRWFAGKEEVLCFPLDQSVSVPGLPWWDGWSAVCRELCVFTASSPRMKLLEHLIKVFLLLVPDLTWAFNFCSVLSIQCLWVHTFMATFSLLY